VEKLVYIIDDDQLYLKFMKEHFKQMPGFQTEVFENGDDCLKKIQEKRPYLIILDNHLKEPNKSGVYYLKQIVKIKPSIPVVYITGDTDSDLKMQVEKIGVESYIIKNQSFLIYLRLTLDTIHEKSSKKKGFISKLFK
jgi:DNA-binding NtrC family response regulator